VRRFYPLPVSTATPKPTRHGRRAVLWLLALLVQAQAWAGGPFGIDHEWTYDDSGIWHRSVQDGVLYGLIGGQVVVALWEGGEDSRLGRTMWQSIDASLASGIASTVLKYAFSRVRPIDSDNDPNLWFKGHGNQSFPSGEVTAISSIVTPVVLEYRHDTPFIYALELLPVYDAFARMKVQAHWQSDVIAGFALGTTAGILFHRQGTPYVLRVMPHAIYIGLNKQF
jgi:hypothetical protein